MDNFLINDSDKRYNFIKCRNRNCKTCPAASISQITNQNSQLPFCKIFNCIYQLTCNICNLSYIGQTSNPLHLRMNVHRDHIKKYTLNNTHLPTSNKFEYKHFANHGFENITINILDIKTNLADRIFFENFYIKSKCTLFPYGLNQLYLNGNIVKNNFVDNKYSIFNHLFINPQLNNRNSVKQKRFKRGKGILRCHDYKAEIRDLHHKFNNSYQWKEIKSWVFAVKKKHINKVYAIFLKLKLDNEHFNHIFYDLLLTRSLYLKLNLNQNINNNPTNSYCVISFKHPIYNSINFSNLFNKFNELLPIKDFKISKAFKYNKPIGRSIFNYNEISQSLTSDLDSTSNLDNCICHVDRYANFINPHLGHIATGDLNIINDVDLRLVMTNGTKFRLQSCNSTTTLLNSITLDLDKYIYKLASKYAIPLEAFNMWKFTILHNIKNTFRSIKLSKSKYNIVNLKQSINELQKSFVITYVDKAANNYAIICKKFYVNYLLDYLNNNNQFKLDLNSINSIKQRIIKMYSDLNIKSKYLKFPYIVLIPKFHKNPIKFRTVTSGHNSYSTTASKLLLNKLNIINESLRYSNNNYFILNNSIELKIKLTSIRNLSGFQTFDFKDLFNSINISDLNKVILSLYNDYFNNHPNLNHANFTHFKNLLYFVIFKNYIFQGNQLYLQVSGVPQGGCSSSMLANLYLLYYELSFTSSDYNIYRYVDDLICIVYSDNYTLDIDFYPDNLELIPNEASICDNVNFLDMNLIIDSSNRIVTNIYDKKDNFNFNVNKLLPFNSCNSIQLFRNIILNQLFRIYRISDNKFHAMHVKNLYRNCKLYNYPIYFVKSIIKSFRLAK